MVQNFIKLKKKYSPAISNLPTDDFIKGWDTPQNTLTPLAPSRIHEICLFAQKWTRNTNRLRETCTNKLSAFLKLKKKTNCVRSQPMDVHMEQSQDFVPSYKISVKKRYGLYTIYTCALLWDRQCIHLNTI